MARVFPTPSGSTMNARRAKNDAAQPSAATEPKEPAAPPPAAPEAAPAESPAAPAGSAPADEAVQRLNERLLRLQADFDNFRKRTQRERAELVTAANEELISGLLPLLDHFELGLRNAREHEANASVIQGFQLVFDQFTQLLTRFGLEPIDALEKHFDPHQHEAVTHLPSEEFPADIVMAQTRRGFRLGGKLLRPAQVVVSRGPAGQEDSGHAPGEA